MKTKLLKFYKLHSWMIEEFGFTREMGAYLLIYSFHENGKACELSQSSFAEVLRCTRMQAFRILKELEDAQYIISESRSARESKVYRINEETLKRMQSTCNTDVTCNMDVTGGCNMDVTLIEKEIEKSKENLKRESARPHSEAAFLRMTDHPEIKLTSEQYDRLKSELSGFDRSLESYLRNLEAAMKSKHKSYEPHFETLMSWIQNDKDKARSGSGSAGNRRGASALERYGYQSSIDMDDLEAIVNAF